MLKKMAQLLISVNQLDLMFKAFLKHYAAFVEAQTGKPSAEVIKEIEEDGDFKMEKSVLEIRAKIETEVLDALTRVLTHHSNLSDKPTDEERKEVIENLENLEKLTKKPL